jgi:hypothetical protein
MTNCSVSISAVFLSLIAEVDDGRHPLLGALEVAGGRLREPS